MNKEKTPIWAIGLSVIVLSALLIGGIATNGARAGGSFWGNIQSQVSGGILDWIKGEAPDMSVDDLVFGGAVPYDINHQLRVRDWFSWGGDSLATTTTGTATTLKASDLLDYGIIDIMTNVAAHTYTLPATSTMMDLLPKVGMSRKWLFHNATSSSGITLTVAAGTGMHLVGVAGAEVIDPEEWMEMTCTQIYYRSVDNENILCIITELEE